MRPVGLSRSIAGSCLCLRMDTVPNFRSTHQNWCRRKRGLEMLEFGHLAWSWGEELEQNKRIICDALHPRPQPVGSYALPTGK
jgi:hypothetical protein